MYLFTFSSINIVKYDIIYDVVNNVVYDVVYDIVNYIVYNIVYVVIWDSMRCRLPCRIRCHLICHFRRHIGLNNFLNKYLLNNWVLKFGKEDIFYKVNVCTWSFEINFILWWEMVFFVIPYFVSLLSFLFQYLPVKEFKLLDDRTAL